MSEEPRDRPTILQEIASVLASFIGMQNSRNRERDFTRGSPRRFVILGVVFTLLFVLLVVGVVKLLLRQAGA
mgnify:CR=1 FL=1